MNELKVSSFCVKINDEKYAIEMKANTSDEAAKALNSLDTRSICSIEQRHYDAFENTFQVKRMRNTCNARRCLQ